MDLADIDLLDRDRFTRGIPHEWFTWLRANQPLYKHPEPEGRGFWVVTKHADVIACNRDAGTFSSAQARGGVVGLEDNNMMQTEAEEAGGRMMLMMDPPDHTRYRKLVNRGFTPRMIGMLEPHIRELTSTILDQALAKDECDFVVDVAAELPLEVIAELIGVPREDRHKIFEWSNRMVGSEDPEYIVSADEILSAQVEMFMYAQALADKRRADRARHERVPREPGPVRPARLGSRRLHHARDRGDPALGVAGHVLPAQRDARHRAARRDDPGRRQDQSLVHLGQPGRGGVRGPVPVRHRA
jgi:cholest-4-en-3-one 26-monooxygenase